MVTASAPHIRMCAVCKIPIDDNVKHFKDNFIKYGLENYEVSYTQCEEFLRKCNIKTGLEYSLCIECLFVKWKNIEITKNKRNKRQAFQDETVNHDRIKKFLQTFCKKWWRIIVVILFSFCLGIISSTTIIKTIFVTSNDVNNRLGISDDTLNIPIEKLKDQFPSLNQNFLGKINSGFLRLKTPGEPFVFLLLHDDTNKKTTDCLVSYTSSLAKKNIFTNTTKSLWMNASEWVQHSSTDDQELLYEKLIVPLKENKVLVLENLQDLPWSLATSFHHLCDTENPQITHAMYLLELKVNNDHLKLLSEFDKMVAAEEAMETAWSDAPNSFREALISRLSSYVDAVLLKSDEECPYNMLSLQSDIFVRISP